MAWWVMPQRTQYSRISTNTALHHINSNFYPLLCLVLATTLIPATLWLSIDRYHYARVSRDTEILSNIPQIVHIFEEDRRFVTDIPYINDSVWWNLFPPNGGFVEIENSGSRRIPTNDRRGRSTSKESERFCISMYHQLHCLASLKVALGQSSSAENQASLHDGDPSHESEEHEHLLDPNHIDHCFDYLRQAIMCAGDTTLEKVSVTVVDDVAMEGVDGWGEMHKCRDWGSIMRFAVEHEF